MARRGSIDDSEKLRSPSVSFCASLVRVTTVTAILSGSAGIISSLAGIPVIEPGAALAVLLTGIAIQLSITRHPTKTVIASVCLLAVLISAILSAEKPFFQMPRGAAVSFALIAFALLLFEVRRWTTFAQVLALLTAFLGLLIVASYILNAPRLYEQRGGTAPLLIGVIT